MDTKYAVSLPTRKAIAEDAPASRNDQQDDMSKQGSYSNSLDLQGHEQNSMVQVRPAGCLGLGVYAVQDITRGTRIIAEPPILTARLLNPEDELAEQELVEDFCSRTQKMSSTELKVLDEFHCNPHLLEDQHMQQRVHEWYESNAGENGHKLNTRKLRRAVRVTLRRLAIFITNRVQMGADGKYGSGLFAFYSRVNHSCSPNIFNCYNHTIGRLTLHATRDIKAGDQILTDYIGGACRPRQQRQEELMSWGFTCTCKSCMDPEEDKIRETIFHLSHGLSLFARGSPWVGSETGALLGVPNSTAAALAQAEAVAALLKHPAVDLQAMPLCRIYRMCANYCLGFGDVHRAIGYARKELEVERLLVGTETDHLRENLDGADYWIEHLEKMATDCM